MASILLTEEKEHIICSFCGKKAYPGAHWMLSDGYVICCNQCMNTAARTFGQLLGDVIVDSDYDFPQKWEIIENKINLLLKDVKIGVYRAITIGLKRKEEKKDGKDKTKK